MPRRREPNHILALFLGISFILHALLAVFFAAWLLFFPRGSSEKGNSPVLQLTFLPSPPMAKREVSRPVREQFVDASESTPVEKPVENTPFVGTRDTKAASEQRNQADLNVPKQAGAKLPGISLSQSEYAPEQAARPAMTDLPEPVEKPQEEKPKPEKEPTTAEASHPPSPTAEAVPLRADGTLYTSEKPPDKQPEEGKNAPKAAQPEASPSRSPPADFSAASMQRRKTQLDGGANTPGNTSIAVRGTELGRYKQKLYNSIGSRWHFLVQKHGSMLEIGIVRVRFTITADGRIKDIQVVQGEHLSTLMRISRQSVFELDQPWEPFSPNMRQQIGDEYTEEVSFTIY